MANWIVLTKVGANADAIAVNLDLATRVEPLPSRTRITFGGNETVDVIQTVSTILDLAKGAVDDPRT